MRGTRYLPALLAVLAIAVIDSRPAAAGSDPALAWRTLVTDHFRINYHQGGEIFARRVADIAEDAYRQCAAFLGLVPWETIEVVVTDEIDESNGTARVYPSDIINIYAFPPDPESDLAYYDDYLRLLVYHEYVHVAHMDTIGGLPAAINTVVGKTAVPNGAINVWFVEGLATFAETRLTRGGRVGSPLFDMYLRMAALGGRLLDLSELTDGTVKFPRGAAPYLYGSYFLDFIYKRHGTGPITAFIRDYGSRVVPFAVNTLARRHFGKTFETLYEEFAEEVRKDAVARAALVHAEGEVAGTPLTTGGEHNESPVFSRDGKGVYFVRSDGASARGVFRIDLVDRRMTRVADCYGGCGHLALAPDGTIVTSHLGPQRIYRYIGDLWRVDPVSGSETRLTRGARARDSSVGGDGTVFYVSSRFDTVWIAALDPATGTSRVVVREGIFTGLGDPREVPGRGRIVFTGATKGTWDLWMADIATGALERITDDGALDRNPAPAPDGRHVFFSTDRNGIYDIHAVDLDGGAVFRVTSVVGGAFQPAVSPDGDTLVFTTYGADGYDLATLPVEPGTWRRVGTAMTASPVGGDFGSVPASRAADVATEGGYLPPPADTRDGTYSPWPSIRPRSLRPTWVFANASVSRLGAEMVASDALYHHSFVTSAETPVASPGATLLMSYGFERWWPSLGLTFATYPDASWAFVDDRWRAMAGRTYLVSLAAGMPIPCRDRVFSVGISYSLRWITGVGSIVGTDPASTEPIYPRLGRRASMTLSASHDSTESYAWSISPERGFSAGVAASLEHPAMGGGGTSWTVGGHVHEYLRMPWARAHVLALLGSAALSRGDRGDRDLFWVGGFPPQDVLMSVVNGRPAGGRYLRGFPSGAFVGDNYFLVNAEYRFPIAYVHRGLGTLPVVARRLWATAFCDVGGAWFDPLTHQDIGWDVGMEVALSTRLFLSVAGTFRLGYARGFGPLGTNVVYFVMGP